MEIRIKRAEKYGFCSGVRVADIKVRRFAQSGGKAAILGQVVHNERVVADLEKLGVRTVQRMEEATEPVIVFSAHGVPPSFHQKARELGLEILDTTCKFVYDIHKEAKKALEAGMHLVFIGERHHREVIGYTHDLDPACYHIVQNLEEAAAVDWSVYPAIKVLFQTTLNAEDFEDVVRFIEARNPNTFRADTVCYATKENQEAARKLARDPEVDLVLVIGGKNSANTRHLFEICQRWKPTYLIQGPENLRWEWFANARCVGITAGASTPDYVVDEVEEAIRNLSQAVANS
ncbi:MAG: 4-hydroxy-3-methylbut-2-enyl diphosphate reductase [Thermoanaerobaculum sp.]